MSDIASKIRLNIVAADITGIETKIYRDIAPPATAYPFMTYFEQLSYRSIFDGDSVSLAKNNMMQFDIWQKKGTENQSMVDEVISLLDSMPVTGANKTVYRVKVADVQRIVEFDDDIIHHAITLNVFHGA